MIGPTDVVALLQEHRTLDIARQLVRRNDGDIEVDSVPGRTEFRVALRVHAPDIAAT